KIRGNKRLVRIQAPCRYRTPNLPKPKNSHTRYSANFGGGAGRLARIRVPSMNLHFGPKFFLVLKILPKFYHIRTQLAESFRMSIYMTQKSQKKIFEIFYIRVPYEKNFFFENFFFDFLANS